MSNKIRIQYADSWAILAKKNVKRFKNVRMSSFLARENKVNPTFQTKKWFLPQIWVFSCEKLNLWHENSRLLKELTKKFDSTDPNFGP